MMGLFGGIESTKKRYDEFQKQGKVDFGTAQGFEGSTVGDLNSLAGQEQGMIDAGGLPPAVERMFGIQSGAITDQAAQARSSFGSELTQRALVSGGRMDPNAALASEVDNNANLDQSEFTARNDLAMNQANMRLQNTNALLDKIMGINTT